MGPAINTEAAVQVIQKRAYLPGDVVVIRRGDGILVSHRLLVVYRKNRIWKALTKADRHRRADAATPINNILGCVKSESAVPISLRCRSLVVGLGILCRQFLKGSRVERDGSNQIPKSRILK